VRLAPAALAALALLAPTAALACPVCNRDLSGVTLFYIAGMMLFPYAVAMTVLKVVRSGEKDGDGKDANERGLRPGPEGPRSGQSDGRNE
jgi:hypothetical protein